MAAIEERVKAQETDDVVFNRLLLLLNQPGQSRRDLNTAAGLLWEARHGMRKACLIPYETALRNKNRGRRRGGAFFFFFSRSGGTVPADGKGGVQAIALCTAAEQVQIRRSRVTTSDNLK